MKKLLATLGVTTLLFLFTACLPQDIQIPQSPLLSTLERKSGMIAYIGADGNIYVSDQGGGNSRALTEDALIPENQSDPFHIYQIPTWSADGQQLAFVGLSGQESETTAQVYVTGLEQETATEIYSGKNETPFYLYWTPDNSNLSILSSTTPGQSLILKNVPAKGGDPVVLDTGTPYFWSWSPDGRVLVVHAGAEGTASVERLAFLKVNSEVMEYGLEVLPASFQAPAWSPDGSRILLATRDDSDENTVIVTDDTGLPQKTLGTFSGETAFSWSHDGEKVAYITGDRVIADGILGALHVANLTTGEEIVQDSQVFAFFWSPDSEKIAYFVPFVSSATPENGEDSSNQELILQLNVLDIGTGESHEVFSFIPTQELLAVLGYFDQYSQSNTIWSPDNNNLVVSLVDGQGRHGIVVVAASGQLEPRLLANGILAFWSWQ